MGEGDDHADAGKHLGEGSRPSGQGNDSQKEDDKQGLPSPPDPDAPGAARIFQHCGLPTSNSMGTRVPFYPPIGPRASAPENRDRDDGADLVLQPDMAAVPRRSTRTTQKSMCSAVRSRGIS